MKKKILLILAAVMLIMSVCVVASADDGLQTVTFTPAQSRKTNGSSIGGALIYSLENVKPGKYLITITAASDDQTAKGVYGKLEVWVTKTKEDFENATFRKTNIDSPIGWANWKQVVAGTHTFTAEDKYLYVINRLTIQRIANITLTPIPDDTITISQENNADQITVIGTTQTMYDGISKGSTAWIKTNAPNGTYALFANVASNGENSKVTCYLNTSIDKDYITYASDLKVPFGGDWYTFGDMFIGFVNITDTHKMVTLSCVANMMRIKSITLMPMDDIRPNVCFIQNDAYVTSLVPGKVIARANISKITDNKKYIPIAAYYENGKLVSAKPATENTYYKAGEWEAVFDSVNAGPNNYVKMFVWDNLENCYPYIEAVTAPIAQ